MSNNVSLFLAFSAGVMSFLSPCILPLIPAYISYITGITVSEMGTGRAKLTTLYKSIVFTIGFSIVFIIMGASISTLGRFFIKNQGIFRKIGGIVIIMFGLHVMGIFRIKYLYYEKRAVSMDKFEGISSLLMGMAFAVGWTPCVGPILASILIYSGNMNTIGRGILLLIFYSSGLAVPFIMSALAVESLSRSIRKISGYFPVIEAVSGSILIIMGLMTITDNMNILNKIL